MTTPNNNNVGALNPTTTITMDPNNTPPLPPPMQVVMSSPSSSLGFNPTPASMIPHHQHHHHHQYLPPQQPPPTYLMTSPSSSSHTILPFGPQSSFPSLISPISNPFPSTIHTSIPPTHFLSSAGNTNRPTSQLSSLSSPELLDKRRRNPTTTSTKRPLEDDDEEDNPNINNIEIDDSGEPPSRTKSLESKFQQQQISKDNGAKGCNCKKTGCLKRYCECFQNNKRCTIKCRCQGCKNYQDCPDLHRVLEKQTKSGSSSSTTNTTTTTTQRKTQKRKLNPISSQAQPGSSSSTITNPQTRPPMIGSPSILGGGVVMSHGSVSQFSPLLPTFTNSQIASSLHHNALSCLYGEEKIVELCKKLVLAAIQQEQVFKDEWKQDGGGAPLLSQQPTKTPKMQVTRKAGEAGTTQVVDNFLLCDEDDMMQQSSQQQSSSQQHGQLVHPGSTPTNRKVYPKGFENALGISLNERITTEFKHFLLSGVQSLKSSQQQQQSQQDLLNNSMQ